MSLQTASELRDRLRTIRVLPVIVIDSPERAVSLAGALAAGGLAAAEITLRTPGALEALRRINDGCPDVLLGAGTVLTTPGLNRAVVQRAQDLGLAVIPGVCTPTEIEVALEMKLTVLKFFPAEPMGGVKFLRAIAAPYASVEFVPTIGARSSSRPRRRASSIRSPATSIESPSPRWKRS